MRRCTYCYNGGHNRRTCEKLTKELQERWERHSARGSTSYADSIAEDIIKRTGVDPRTGKPSKKAKQKVRCTYCNYKHGRWRDVAEGHTRRSCKELKADKLEAVRDNREYRKLVLDNLQRLELGVGAILRQNVSGYYPGANDKTVVWRQVERAVVIKTIHWDNVCHLRPYDHVFTAQALDKLGSRREGVTHISLPYFFDKSGDRMRTKTGSRIGRWSTEEQQEENNSWANKPTFLSGVSGDTIKPPSGWFGGISSIIEEEFKARTKKSGK